MRPRIWLLLVVMLSLVAISAAPGAARAQDEERDLAEAVATADEILRLAYERKFNAMYDRIHPDAHAVVPRATAIGAFEDIYAETQAGRGEVVDARLTEWTWGVTGESYPNAAEIDFRQPYVDENGQDAVLEDRLYLVESDGEWRWFFGNSPEFVEQANELYGVETGEPLTDGDLIQNVVNDLDAFYRDVFSYTDFNYQTPGIVVVAGGDSAMSACGPAQTGFLGFYCPPDQTIYLDEPFLLELQGQADFAAAFVIAHEWAHHVQTSCVFIRVDPGDQPDGWNEVYSIDLELMADCFAGAWALDVDTRGMLEPDDVEEAMQFTVDRLGDPQFIGEYDPQAHGSADQRVQAFLLGYESGFEGCNISI
jgi:predicted metalloprotease